MAKRSFLDRLRDLFSDAGETVRRVLGFEQPQPPAPKPEPIPEPPAPKPQPPIDETRFKPEPTLPAKPVKEIEYFFNEVTQKPEAVKTSKQEFDSYESKDRRSLYYKTLQAAADYAAPIPVLYHIFRVTVRRRGRLVHRYRVVIDYD